MALELLSPAGSPEALRAAVQSGCGAVYLGWGNFNARRSAKNFSDEEFADAIRYCHLRGIRVFLTLNTLLTDRELPLALDAARTACRLGVDSVLVQDWGLFALLREALPDLPLHASTQMSVFTAGGANEVYVDGCERVVLARECSREDTAAICKACPAEIEIFGHGALCMCYSGQCEMSALIGGRSGNRGTCAQPCRLPYGFNGPAKNTYPLSLKDSCLADRISDMERMDVSCLKLEGRMKRPEYVAAAVSAIRTACEGRPVDFETLRSVFSRSGFTKGYFDGRIDREMFGYRQKEDVTSAAGVLGVPVAAMQAGLRVAAVRGRCEVVPCPAPFTVVLDYAHNAAAAESVLTALRAYHPRRLITVFGCGGGRSRLRRTGMGEACARLADLCIVTEDNSRGEPLENIFADIRAGMDRVQNGAACVEIPNRRDALLYALGLGREGDILAVLGKGHETTIDRDGRKVPFEDAAVVREYMERVK